MGNPGLLAVLLYLCASVATGGVWSIVVTIIKWKGRYARNKNASVDSIPGK